MWVCEKEHKFGFTEFFADKLMPCWVLALGYFKLNGKPLDLHEDRDPRIMALETCLYVYTLNNVDYVGNVD